MNTSEEILRRRERENFTKFFELGDQIIKHIESNDCTIKEACSFFSNQFPYTERMLRATERTARIFPLGERNPSVGFTKHQALAEVSRQNIEMEHTDQEWRHALREALVHVRDDKLKVNTLNSAESVRKLMRACLERVKYH